jgi:hypothetical protein
LSGWVIVTSRPATSSDSPAAMGLHGNSGQLF